jgi:plasmid stabilization system protein ParE
MDYQVAFSKSAVAELQEILAFISGDDPQAGRKYYEKLRREAISLRNFPERHAAILYPPNVRKFPVRPYTVFYRVNKSKRRVTILHFWHSARQPPYL